MDQASPKNEQLKQAFKEMVWADVQAGEKLEVVSQMLQDGVILSDGVASISVAEEKARLVAT